MNALLHRAAGASSPSEQLALLLEAWRETRQPRIAELIERLSARLLEGVPPIKGKSVAARLEAIAERCAKKDPVEIGRVLASEWPGTWQTALPMLSAIVALPDDPRVARALAEQVDLTRYDTWTSKTFYQPLFRRLNQLRDVRQLPLLEAQLARNKTFYYQRDMRPLEEHAVEVLRKVTIPPLTADDAELLRALEAPFASEAATEHDTERDGARLLAAVYERPTDLAARAVYGDWLTERKDPRGELISLQLSPPTPKSQRRVVALIKKHWQSWLGPLADWFRKPPVFEAGFPVEGSVEAPSYHARAGFAALVDRPEWSTFRRLSIDHELLTPAQLVRAPRFRSVTELVEVRVADLPELLEVGSPTLRWLEVMYAEGDALPSDAFAKLPALEVLRLMSPTFGVFGPALPPLARLELVLRGHGVDGWAPFVARTGEVIVEHASGGRARLLADTPGGPFTELALLDATWSGWMFEDLPVTLRRITSANVAKVKVSQRELDEFARRCSRFPQLEVNDLPYELAAPPPPAAPHVGLSFSGVVFFEEAKLARLWKILSQSFGVAFDTLDVRGGLALGPDPVDRLTTWCRNQRCQAVTLQVKGAPTRFRLLRDEHLYTNAALPLGDPERFVTALDELLAFARPTFLQVSVGKRALELKGAEVGTRIGEVHALLRSAPAAAG